MFKSYQATPETADRNWVVVDVENCILGRVATKIANLLRGKHKPQFTPNVDIGDFVVVINAGKVRLTGKKWDDKLYHHHSGYPGGLKTRTATEVLNRHPDELLRSAVYGMLPRNRLSRQIIKKLKIYPGVDHPHAAQHLTTMTV